MNASSIFPEAGLNSTALNIRKKRLVPVTYSFDPILLKQAH